MNDMVWTHAVYLVVSVAVTVWVGRTLQRHGKVFAKDGNAEDDVLIDAFSPLRSSSGDVRVTEPASTNGFYFFLVDTFVRPDRGEGT